VTTAQATGAPAPGVWPSAAVAWWGVAALIAAAFLCTMDRLVLNLLVDPIRADLRISETQFSLLQGASFTIVNAIAALPLGLLADRSSRRLLLIGGVLVWSVATTAGGLAHGFQSFFIARIFVGLGEAALWPVAVSLIASLLPPARRGRAISLVLLGQILGSGASLIMTGVVLKLAAGHRLAALPVIDALAPWRVVLVLWGFLGAPVILLLLSAREPARQGTGAEARAGAVDLGGLGRFLTFLSRRWSILIPMYLGAGCVSVGSYALAAWAPSFFIRRFALHPSDLGPVLGTIGIGGGILGTTLAGFIADRQERLGQPGRKLTALMIAALACVPVSALCLAPSPTIAYAIQGASLIFFPIAGALNIIAMQDLVPGDMRGKAMAVLALVSSLFGATLGPTLVALATQHLFHDPAKVGVSIAIVLAPAMLIAAGCFLAAREGRKGMEVGPGAD
jgi:MFS family permease